MKKHKWELGTEMMLKTVEEERDAAERVLVKIIKEPTPENIAKILIRGQLMGDKYFDIVMKKLLPEIDKVVKKVEKNNKKSDMNGK